MLCKKPFVLYRKTAVTHALAFVELSLDFKPDSKGLMHMDQQNGTLLALQPFLSSLVLHPH